MKLRNIILLTVFAVVAATVPFLLFNRGEEAEGQSPGAEPGVTPVTPESTDHTTPDSTAARPTSPRSLNRNSPDAKDSPGDQPPTGKEKSSPEKEVVSRAVAAVTQAAGQTPGEKSSGSESPPAFVPADTGEPMKVGLVTGKAELDPALAGLAKNGVLAVTEERWADAKRIYLELVQKAPDNALAYANLGVAEHQLGNDLAAAGNLKRSLDINPGIARNWQTLGLIQFERGELEMAISSITRAIHEDPSDARSRLYLAAVIRDYGWNDAAITELERAIEIDPELAEAHYNIAISYLDEKPPRIELARRHYYSAIDLGAPPAPDLEAVFAPREEKKR